MGRVGSLMQQLQHPRNLAHLLERVEQSASHHIQLNKEAGLLYMARQGGRAIIYGWTRRQGYYIRLDKEAGLLYGWTSHGAEVLVLGMTSTYVNNTHLPRTSLTPYNPFTSRNCFIAAF